MVTIIDIEFVSLDSVFVEFAVVVVVGKLHGIAEIFGAFRA